MFTFFASGAKNPSETLIFVMTAAFGGLENTEGLGHFFGKMHFRSKPDRFFGCVFSRGSFFLKFWMFFCSKWRSRLGAGAFSSYPILNFQTAIFGSSFFLTLWLRQLRLEIVLPPQRKCDFLELCFGCNSRNIRGSSFKLNPLQASGLKISGSGFRFWVCTAWTVLLGLRVLFFGVATAGVMVEV